MLCGYLSADLKGAADDILLASSESIEITARDTREPGARSEEQGAPEPEPYVEPEPELRFERAHEPEPQPQLAMGEEDPLDAGVTPSADWEYDDDPSSYSAPI